MAKYKIMVEEILSRVIEVEAEDILDAIQEVREKYKNEEIVLNADDYATTDFYSLD